jgi:hypothetical protein
MNNAYLEKIMIDKMIIDELSKGKHPKATREAIETCKELLIQHKREYRAWLKLRYGKKYLYSNQYGEIVNRGGEYDVFWQKIFFPGERWTDEEKNEFIEENWIYAMPSQYDCTGQTFTWAIDVFNVPSGVVAYIRNAIDV